MSILEVQQVSKYFKGVRVVDGVSLSLEPGDNLAIIGESGSGKTTLAKMIMGLISPDQGNIQAQRQSLQMVFQDPNQSLDPLWNVRSILKEALWTKRSLSASQKEAQMAHILKAVGLAPDVLGRFPHEFSGGERQRLCLARCLLSRPKVLVLDEAVSALDTLVQKQIMDLLKQLKQDFNLTYIFISHNLRLVRHFSDKIAVMYQGKIIEEGAVSAILQSPSHPYTQELVRTAFYRHL
ncbi:MAG: ABC transporter ATP-binding protein [Candidatus Omnitrophica bacterium]|nr:ABC transporter ATP-binding protein [Candidatus Omnitrophota bacterium]MDE2223090.1 ABC transporter ATP-binding protein [Candidatus Omnitrophota bacterium]